jgi:hypothetical protein
MSVQFFNFGNQQTFHYFDWLTRSGSVDTDQLIARAFEELAKNTDDQITLTEEAMGTSEALRDVLARQLRERLEAILPLQADL